MELFLSAEQEKSEHMATTDFSSNNLPIVSVIIPCRNEEKFIAKCLDSIIEQDYPKDKLEVLVVDGMSEDRTREIMKENEYSESRIKFGTGSKKTLYVKN